MCSLKNEYVTELKTTNKLSENLYIKISLSGFDEIQNWSLDPVSKIIDMQKDRDKKLVAIFLFSRVANLTWAI